MEAAGLRERQNELESAYDDEDGAQDEEHRCLCPQICEPLALSSDDWLATYVTDPPVGKSG